MNSSASTGNISTGTPTKEWTLKLILLGDTNVGKTSLLRRYTQDEPPTTSYKPTVGVDFRTKHMQIEGELVRVLIWDTAGQERFRTMTEQYYRGSHGVVLVYDVTNPDSFLHVQNWLGEFEKCVCDDRVKKILVGNKCDIGVNERRVSEVDGQLLGVELDIPFYETSAKTGSNVAEMFQRIVSDLILGNRRGNAFIPSISSCWNLNSSFFEKTKEDNKRNRRCCFS